MVPALSPHRKKHLLIEKIQGNASKIVQEWKDVSYEERWKPWISPPVEGRKDLGNMIISQYPEWF